MSTYSDRIRRRLEAASDRSLRVWPLLASAHWRSSVFYLLYAEQQRASFWTTGWTRALRKTIGDRSAA